MEEACRNCPYLLLAMDGERVTQDGRGMTWEEYFDGKSDTELQHKVQGLHDVIENGKCFGSSDLIIYRGVIAELERRGYELHEFSTIKFSKAKSQEEAEAIR